VTFGLSASQAPNVTNNTKGASSLAFSPSRLEHQRPNVTHTLPSPKQVTFEPPVPSKSRLNLLRPNMTCFLRPNVTCFLPSSNRDLTSPCTKRDKHLLALPFLQT
ncbi:hypothetical protein PIB30_110952, partial [Stylosanthes scabra]|nr:hypothetical protein [Stylosanthes scabra]